MIKQKNNQPVEMEFTIASIQEGIEYWLNNVVLRETIVVDEVSFNPNEYKFTVKLANGIQIGIKS